MSGCNCVGVVRVKAKKIRFGPGDTIGGTAPLIMLRDIEGYEPKRRRAKWGRAFAWLFLAAMVVATGWVIAEAIQRGVLLSILG